MIPIETIKRLAIQCGFQDDMETVGFISCDYDQLQAFAHAIEAMTVDRCITKTFSFEAAIVPVDFVRKQLRALKDEE